jgi:hypothetical protein
MNYYPKTWTRFYSYEWCAYCVVMIIGMLFKISPLIILGIGLIFLRTLSYFLFYRELGQLINSIIFGLWTIFSIIESVRHVNRYYHLFMIIYVGLAMTWYLILSNKYAKKFNLRRKLGHVDGFGGKG